MSKPEFGELFIDHGEDDRNAIHLYISQPSPLEEKNLGRIFSLIEIEDPEPFYEDVIDSIDSTLTKGYYFSSDFDVEVAFERALHKVNKSVQDAISQHGEGWVYKCNALLGVIRNEEVHLAYVGDVEAFLVQKNDIIDILQKDSSAEIKPLKLFNNIISGECGKGMRLVFATSNLLDYLSLEKIRRTALDNPPDISSTEMESVLTENTTLSNIAAITIATDVMQQATVATGDTGNVEEEIQERAEQFIDEESVEEDDTIEDSMDKLISQERSTGELLTPSIWPSLKKRLQKAADQKNEPVKQMSNNPATEENTALKVLKAVWQFLRNLGIQIAVGLMYVGKAIGRAISNNDGVKGSVDGARNWFTRLSTPRKVFLVVALVVFLFFIFSILFNRQSNQNQQIETNYTETLVEVENLLGQAESKQVLGDESGARTSVNQANDLLGGVPTDSDAFQEKGSGLQSRIDAIQADLNKVITVEPTLLGDYGSVEGFAGADSISKIGDNIFAFSNSAGSVYRLNLDTGGASEIIGTADGDGPTVAVENDTNATSLVAQQSNTFAQFNPVLEKMSAVNVAVGVEDLAIQDIDLFNSRLYILDAQNNQIYRHNKSGDAYGTGSEWLDSSVNIGNAIAFDIDSSVYLLTNEGSVRKLDGGTESEFTVEQFTPGLQGATRIYKDVPGNPVYVLNPAANTLVVLNDDGTLQGQYTAGAFNDLKDMAVDESTGTIYLLAGSSVYEVKIEL